MYKHGKFIRPGQVKSSGEKPPAEKPPKSQHEMEHGESQAPHGGSGEEHVTKTHPGQTQPHPVTGVHAFHAHHTGGGKYRSHTHHDGGEVETRDHESHGDMMAAHQEAFPPDEQGGQDQGGMGGYEDALSGVGGVGSE